MDKRSILCSIFSKIFFLCGFCMAVLLLPQAARAADSAFLISGSSDVGGYYQNTTNLDAKYSIHFDANKPATATHDVEGAMNDFVDLSYTTNVVATNGFVIKGYRFLRWNTAADGTGASYSPTQNLSPQLINESSSEPFVLYACWEPITYDLEFFPGTGSGTIRPQRMTYDATEQLTPNAFQAPSGYVFGGWQRALVMGGQMYADQATVCNLCSFDRDGSALAYGLTALWVPTGFISVIITNNGIPMALAKASDLVLKAPNGASFTPFEATGQTCVYRYDTGKQQVPYGSYQLTINPIDPQGVTVVVSQTSPTNVVHLSYCTVETDADAHASMTVGDPPTDIKEYVRIGSDLPIRATAEKGYIFKSFTASGHQPLWQNGDPGLSTQTITVTGSTLLRAHPAELKYQVNFNPNCADSTGSMLPQNMLNGEPQNLFANAFIRKGYVFLGWSSQPDGGGVRYQDQQQVENLTIENGATVELYAQWITVPKTGDSSNPLLYGALLFISCLCIVLLTARRKRS